jgi:predicted outer membrane protein
MHGKLVSKAMLIAPLFFLLTVAEAAPVPAPPTAQSPSPSTEQPPTAATALQQMFMANRMQIQAAELAKQKAQSAQVERFADRLWRDHRLAEHKIERLAKRLGINLHAPVQMKEMTNQAGQESGKAPAGEQQQPGQIMAEMISKLKSASGPQFDKAYVAAMAESQQQILHALQGLNKKLDKRQVTGLIDKLIPIVKQHEALARHLQSHAAA